MAVATKTKSAAKQLDLNEVIKLMSASISASMDEMSQKMTASQAETDRAIQKMTASQAASRAETDKAIQKLTASQAETDKAIQRMSDRIDALSVEVAETTQSVKEIVGGLTQNVNEIVGGLTQNVNEVVGGLTQNVNEIVGGFGRVNNRLGYLIEFIVAPGIRHEMNKLGFRFSYGKPNKIFHGIVNGKKEIITEVDMLLTNGKEVMAAEVKTSLTVQRVKECLDKIAELRDYEEHTKIQGKKLYGAVVGLYIEPDARAYALKNGLYVLKIEERDKLLIVEKPTRPRTW